MKNALYITLLWFGIPGLTIPMMAQSDPDPFDLSAQPYSLTEWASSSGAGNYPTSMAFQQFSSKDPSLTDKPDSDYECPYNLTSRSRIVGLDTGGIEFLNTSSSQNSSSCLTSGGYGGAAVLSLNTRGRQTIQVSFIAGTIAQGTGTPVPRIYAIRLQYRTSATDRWMDFNTPVEYSSENKTKGASDTFHVMLPPTCEDQSFMELRWKYYQANDNGSGNRPAMNLDNISVTSDPLVVTALSSGTTNPQRLSLYPNPVSGNRAQLTKVVSGEVFNIANKKIASLDQSNEIRISGWTEGTYILRTQKGETVTFVVR